MSDAAPSRRAAAPARLNGIGLAVFLSGWAALLGALGAWLVGWTTRAMEFLPLASLALCLQASGALLLVVDTLRVGFGSLDWFFREALARSERRAAAQAAPSTQPQGATVTRRGQFGDRPYVIYGDGTVAVETLLGVRVFASLAEAQEFVGA